MAFAVVGVAGGEGGARLQAAGAIRIGDQVMGLGDEAVVGVIGIRDGVAGGITDQGEIAEGVVGPGGDAS